MSLNEDSDLIKKYLDGDGASFSILVKKYFKHAYNFAFLICQDQGLSEDVVQESFLKLWKNLSKFDSKHSFKPWFFSILRNTAIDWLRKKKDVPLSYFEDDEDDIGFVDFLSDDKDLLSEIMNKNDLSQINNFINELSPRYREVVALRLFENMQFEEVAFTLKRPIGTVKSQYKRALDIIKSKIQ